MQSGRGVAAAPSFFVRPAWARPWRCKSSRKQAIATEANRNCGRATDRGKEAGSETAGRRTGSGYEAPTSGASGQRTVSLDGQGSGGVDPTVVRRRVVFLPGETSTCA